MIGLFENGIGFDGFELGLEASETAGTEGAAVGATTGVGEVVAVVLGFVTGFTPKGQISTTNT